MIINKTFNETIKIKDLAYLNDLGCEVIEYYPNNNTLNGRVYVTGAYHSSRNDEVKLISEDIEFNFEFDKDDFYVEDIECVSFDYNLLEGVGIEVSFEIKLDLSMPESLDTRDAIDIDYEEEIESIKEEIESVIDEKLSNKLEIVDDNVPQNEGIFRSLKNESNTIKVVYFNEEKELSKIAENNNVSMDYLFKTNKSTDFNNNKRIIIKYGK